MITSSEVETMNEHLEKEEKYIHNDEGNTLVLNLGTYENMKEVCIRSNLSEAKKEEFTQILKEYVDVFAWSYADMPGLNSDIVMHEIPTKPECRPIKQKLRKLVPECSLKVKEEVMKQLRVELIRVI